MFNPRIDRYDRRSAERLFLALWPNAGVRQAVASTLKESVRCAHVAGDSCWTLNMFGDYLRLNVGPVEVLVLTASCTRFVCAIPLSVPVGFPHEIDDSRPYRSVPVGNASISVDAENLPGLPSEIREAHNAFLRAAAARQRVPSGSWREAFSPSVLEYIERVLGASLPRPAYFAQTVEQVYALPDEVDETAPIYEGVKYRVTVNATSVIQELGDFASQSMARRASSAASRSNARTARSRRVSFTFTTCVRFPRLVKSTKSTLSKTCVPYAQTATP